MFTFCNKISSPGDYECSPLAQRASPAQSPVTLHYGECHPLSHRPAPAHTVLSHGYYTVVAVHLQGLQETLDSVKVE